MKWIEVCNVNDLPDGMGRLVMGLYGKPIALFHIHDHFYAVNAICPHMGGPLQSGRLEEMVIFCPWHQWSFCIDTGNPDHPGGHRISTYQVKVENGSVWVGWLKDLG
jgi:nitrite reductase (NADH) small subunit/3-phenylpropionate/trans-cinnamate dioxygenase ferredoxin subunit